MASLPEHPRLYVTNAELAPIKNGIQAEPRLDRWYKILQESSDDLLKERLVEHKLKGPRLLGESRKALGLISTLAGLHRLQADPKLRDRAVKEMLAAAAFPDWNPSHFLDTAEMTNALAIGYDWLYDELSPQDRQTIRNAIVELGLKQGLKVYQSQKGWSRNQNNWNQVCNGGMVAGAIAIGDEEPDLASQILDASKESIVYSMRSFAPDGGWEEGPGYWSYATSYNVFYLDALSSALKSDFGFSKLPGFDQAGLFRMHTVGPIRKTFNFADASEGVGSAPQMLWLAHAFDRPGFALHEIGIAGSRVNIFHLFWSGGNLPSPGADFPPLDAVFRRVQVACFRSSWEDPDATYLALKGGDNRAGHSHLDLGGFVLDALGERWAVDLGGDDYDLPSYFGGKRWTYFRLRTESHNTLTLDDENQNTSAKAPLVAFSSKPEEAFAVADLTQAYAPKASRALRGYMLSNRRDVLIRDEIDLLKPADLTWGMVTKAKVALESKGATARLTQNGKSLLVRILEPAQASFVIDSANPPPPQRQQPDASKLALKIPGATGKIKVLILMSPEAAPIQVQGLSLEPLENWVKQAPLQPFAASE